MQQIAGALCNVKTLHLKGREARLSVNVNCEKLSPLAREGLRKELWFLSPKLIKI